MSIRLDLPDTALSLKRKRIQETLAIFDGWSWNAESVWYPNRVKVDRWPPLPGHEPRDELHGILPDYLFSWDDLLGLTHWLCRTRRRLTIDRLASEWALLLELDMNTNPDFRDWLVFDLEPEVLATAVDAAVRTDIGP